MIDIGTLTSMKQLPVMQLNYGGAFNSLSSIEFDLGPLRCSGMRIHANNFLFSFFQNFEQNKPRVRNLTKANQNHFRQNWPKQNVEILKREWQPQQKLSLIYNARYRRLQMIYQSAEIVSKQN